MMKPTWRGSAGVTRLLSVEEDIQFKGGKTRVSYCHKSLKHVTVFPILADSPSCVLVGEPCEVSPPSQMRMDNCRTTGCRPCIHNQKRKALGVGGGGSCMRGSCGSKHVLYRGCLRRLMVLRGRCREDALKQIALGRVLGSRRTRMILARW